MGVVNNYFDPTFGSTWGGFLGDIDEFIEWHGTSHLYRDTSVTPHRLKKDFTHGHFAYLISGSSASTPWGDFEYHSPGAGGPDPAPGAAVFLTNCSAGGVDYDADARFDQLVVESELDITEAGQMFVSATVSSAGTFIAGRSNSGVSLPSLVSIDAVLGTMPVQVGLSGEDIAQSGLDGPYSVTLIVINAAGEILDSQTCETPQLFAYQFGESPAVIAGSSDQGIDDDGDTLFNRLNAQIEVKVFEEGDYTIAASLLGSTGRLIAFADNKMVLNNGSSFVNLYFSGEDINRFNEPGPYQLEAVLLDATGRQVDNSILTTSLYNPADFDSKGTVISGNYDSFGTDTNSNGKYEYLTVEADITVEQAQRYKVSCWLQDGEGKDIAHVETEKALVLGTQRVSLNFDGARIYQHGADGPYTIIYILVKDSQGIIGDAVRNVYKTSAYQSMEFEAPPQPLVTLTGNYNDAGMDTDGDSFFDQLMVAVQVESINGGNVVVEAHLKTTEGVLLGTKSNYAPVQANTPTWIPMNFDGRNIFAGGADGPYLLSFVRCYHTGDPSKDHVEYDAYATGPYSIGEFESTATIKGTVMDSSGLAIGGAVISADGTTAYSDINGDYFINLPSSGILTVGIEPPAGIDDGPWGVSVNGGPMQTGEPVDITVDEDTSTTVDFVLQSGSIIGDLDGDQDIDRDDLNIILAARNTPAQGPDDPMDIDGDGKITALDARKLVTMCTRHRCAVE